MGEDALCRSTMLREETASGFVKTRSQVFLQKELAERMGEGASERFRGRLSGDAPHAGLIGREIRIAISGADDDAGAAHKRLDHIVGEGSVETSTDHGHVSQPIDRGQFPNGIQEDDLGSFDLLSISRARAADRWYCRGPQQIFYFIEPFRASGSDEKARRTKACVFGLEDFERAEDQRFFARCCAPGDNERAVGGESKASRQLFDSCRLVRWGTRIPLHIADDVHAFPGGTQFAHPAGVLFALQEQEAEVFEDASHERANPSVSAERAIREATAHQQDRNVSSGALAQEIRPDLRFQDKDEAWMKSLQSARDGEGPIEREIDDPRLGRVAAAGDLLSRLRHGREHELERRGAFYRCGEGFDQGLGGENLADRDAVNPKDRLLLRK